MISDTLSDAVSEIRDYLRRALSHPALASLRDFYHAHGLLEERTL